MDSSIPIKLNMSIYHLKIVLDGQASDLVHVLSGVPQSPDNIRSSVRLFADDCVLCRNTYLYQLSIQ